MKEKKVTLTETAVRFLESISTVREIKELASILLSHMEGIETEMKSASVRNIMKQVKSVENVAARRHAEYVKSKKVSQPNAKATPATQQVQTMPRPYMAVRYPTTPEEVQSIAANACKRMTKEEAEMYLACRESLGWKNANGQMIQNVGADIRMWALKADDKRRANGDITKKVAHDFSQVM